MTTRSRARSAILVLLCSLFGVAVVALMPRLLPPTMDFSQLYLATKRALTNEPLYGASPEMPTSQIPTEQLRGDPPCTIPPWYVATFLPLGALDPERAATLWGLLNILFLVGIINLSLPELSPRLKTLLISLALLSATTQGHIIVGQFTLLPSLGVALALWGIKNGLTTAIAGGLALSTYKPHFGIPIIACFLLSAIFQRDGHLRSLISRLVFFAILLAAASLWVDPTSLTSYPHHLRALNDGPVNRLCDSCSSMTIQLVRAIDNAPGNVWLLRFGAAALMMSILVIPYLLKRSDPRLLLSLVVCATLLATPYARNYDYVLLLAPLLVTWRSSLDFPKLSKMRISRALVAVAVTIVGILPYFLNRQEQSSVLWVAALASYVAVASEIRIAREPRH